MRLVGFSLLCAIETASLFADQPPGTPETDKLSSRLAAEIRASLPQYSPPAADAPSNPESMPPSDSNLLILPKITVNGQPPPKIEPNDLMISKALDRKLAREFNNSLTGLDAILNGFSIPLVGPSMVARGRAAYKARHRGDLNNFIQSTSAADPKAGAKLKDAVKEMDEAHDWQTRVTGGK